MSGCSCIPGIIESSICLCSGLFSSSAFIGVIPQFIEMTLILNLSISNRDVNKSLACSPYPLRVATGPQNTKFGLLFIHYPYIMCKSNLFAGCQFSKQPSILSTTR